ncbi:hypothetical protein DPMN_007250 [Dreissena polymorpha]|uniref:Uncharacterized protein n=1 Tax=Dreissena polymorpha TaxID=45954 RepID=A0A9D4MVJ3_DREPO|nr:hypothetical protein DPMN_007250 [Dreissena polymorpha]
MGYTWTYIPHGTHTDPSKPSCSNKIQESRNVYRVSFDVRGLDSQITNEYDLNHHNPRSTSTTEKSVVFNSNN